MFQSVVQYNMAGGIPGEFAFDGPRRAEPGILEAAGTVGLIFTENPAKPGFWKPGFQAGAVRFAILTTPKQYANYAGGLAPSMTLPANAEGEFTSMGQVWAINTVANAKAGDAVFVVNATGAIATAAPGAAAPAGSTLVPGAVVAPRPSGAAPGLVVVTLNGPINLTNPA